MLRSLFLTILFVLAPFVWGQTPPPPPSGPDQGASLTDQGFTEAEATSIDADLRAFDQANRITDADLRVIEAQRQVLMTKDVLDRGEFEKSFRAQYELLLKKELARVDLINKWRKTFGVDKVRFLEPRLKGGDQGPPRGQPPQNPPSKNKP